MLPIVDVAAKLGLGPDDLVPYGRDKAKLPLELLDRPRKTGKLVLVTAITPTPAGEGKTTTTIGLVQGLERTGRSACAALREPSLGPCFGVKGGGTGGGKAILVPTADINLHFTGDLHAITAAHNLISAVVDNHLHWGATPTLDARKVSWPRVMDQNDRSLRHVLVGLGGGTDGFAREGSFDITAASEVMAMLCLADSPADLRARIDRAVVGATPEGKPVTVGDLGVTGAAMALLRDAMLPNLVQTCEGTPAIVHGGPFANIAHGCNSVTATRMALGLADWVVTEAGFAADLGAEKFIDIKCRTAGLDPAVVVVVATVRALRWHGGANLKDVDQPDVAAVGRGLENLGKHLETVAAFGRPAVVALNGRTGDTPEEIEVIRAYCAERGASFAASTHFANGGAGAIELAEAVVRAAAASSGELRYLYDLDAPIPAKIEAIAKTAYGAASVAFTPAAKAAMKRCRDNGWDKLPICMAKTSASLSDDAKLRGRPRDFEVTVQDLRPSLGAGFLVALCGDISRMPGLPRRPAALDVDLVDGVIVGVE